MIFEELNKILIKILKYDNKQNIYDRKFPFIQFFIYKQIYV